MADFETMMNKGGWIISSKEVDSSSHNDSRFRHNRNLSVILPMKPKPHQNLDLLLVLVHTTETPVWSLSTVMC